MTNTISKKSLAAFLFFMFLITAAFLAADGVKADEPQTEPERPPYTISHTSVTFNNSYSEPWKALWLIKQDKVPTATGFTYTHTYENIPEGKYSCPGKGSIINIIPTGWSNNISPLHVYPLKAGSTTITVTPPAGDPIQILVTVSSSYFKTALANNSYFSFKDDDEEFNNMLVYGERKYTGSDTVPNAKITVKCGKQTINTTADNKGDFRFTLKKIYKFKTKGWIKYTAGGATYKENLKVSCGSTIKHKQGNYKSKGTKTRIAFKVKNLHKGDKITVKINGSSYTKKITNVRAKTIYVPVSRTIAYTPFKVTLKNKYRQKMLVKTLYL